MVMERAIKITILIVIPIITVFAIVFLLWFLFFFTGSITSNVVLSNSTEPGCMYIITTNLDSSNNNVKATVRYYIKDTTANDEISVNFTGLFMEEIKRFNNQPYLKFCYEYADYKHSASLNSFFYNIQTATNTINYLTSKVSGEHMDIIFFNPGHNISIKIETANDMGSIINTSYVNLEARCMCGPDYNCDSNMNCICIEGTQKVTSGTITTCTNGSWTSKSCGSDGQIPCPIGNGSSCSYDHYYLDNNGMCKECGKSGAIACPTEPQCFGEHNTPLNGTCVYCGKDNSPCCKYENNTCWLWSTECRTDNYCHVCGTFTEEACQIGSPCRNSTVYGVLHGKCVGCGTDGIAPCDNGCNSGYVVDSAGWCRKV
jgi:hypothetical protein